jgi:predicted nicotinamide N-methyase
MTAKSHNASTPAEFIVANTVLTAPPLIPEIRLYSASEVVPLWQMTEEELNAAVVEPPYWAFAWAGGQALARYALDNPKVVQGRRVLDLGAGSGLVSIAVLMAGAAGATASDPDTYAQAAVALNAAANGVAVPEIVGDCIGEPAGRWDLILVGDVFYERALSARLEGWLRGLVGQGVEVLVGDPRRTYLPREGIDQLAQYSVPTSRELEDTDVRNACVWRLHAD